LRRPTSRPPERFVDLLPDIAARHADIAQHAIVKQRELRSLATTLPPLAQDAEGAWTRVDDSAQRIASVSKRSEEEARQSLAAMNRHGKLIHPDGVATMILSVCLPQSRDVNGAALAIDGGTTA